MIQSSYKLFYEAAQDVIDGVKTAREVQDSIPELYGLSEQRLSKRYRMLRETLLTLSKVAQVIQDKREKMGALQLESTEVRELLYIYKVVASVCNAKLCLHIHISKNIGRRVKI